MTIRKVRVFIKRTKKNVYKDNDVSMFQTSVEYSLWANAQSFVVETSGLQGGAVVVHIAAECLLNTDLFSFIFKSLQNTLTSLIVLTHSLPSGKIFGYQLLWSPTSLFVWIVSRKHHWKIFLIALPASFPVSICF